MISQDEARARVAKGAALLDQARPGWAQRIDIGTLSLGVCRDCILGQVFKHESGFWPFQYGLQELDLSYVDVGPCGVGGFYFDGDVQLIQDAWIEAIADRIHATPESLAAVDPGVQSIPESLRA